MNLGDQHNFGRAVKQQLNGDVFKPRCIFWESQILCQSKLRDQFYIKSRSAGVSNPLEDLPEFSYKMSNEFPYEGTVNFVQGLPPQIRSEQNASSLGSLIAMCVFFGIGDLHRQNLFFELDENKNAIAPLDVESIFFQNWLPSQTMLVAPIYDKHGVREACGLTSVLQSIGDSSPHLLFPLLESYENSIRFFLREMVPDAIDFFREGTLMRAPIRIVLRPTQEYANWLKGEREHLTFPLYPEEEIQLSRGDIPYFFRFTESPKLYYFETSNFEYTEFRSLPSNYLILHGIADLVTSNLEIPGPLCDNPDIHIVNGQIQLAHAAFHHIASRDIECRSGDRGIWKTDKSITLQLGSKRRFSWRT